MCHFLSGVIDKATGQKLYFGQLNSHSGIEAGHSLKPDSYREFEWTEDDDGDSLVVRVSDMDIHDENWYKDKILSKYPTRKDLLKYISTIVCKTDKLNEYRYDDKGVKISSVRHFTFTTISRLVDTITFLSNTICSSCAN